jgi:hypothetical protein
VRRKPGYTDTFLVDHGAAPGSTIIMTPTGYMTVEGWANPNPNPNPITLTLTLTPTPTPTPTLTLTLTLTPTLTLTLTSNPNLRWVAMAPSMATGIRAMPVIKTMPEWWVLKIIDGFGPHVSSLDAMEIYESHKILLLKEEGDSSHVNQAYDQDVAKKDKICMRSCLGWLRQSEKLSKTIVDGWDLIHVGLSAVRELPARAWIASFMRVNLHPHHRVDFPTWCVRIANFLQGGASFKPELTAVDTYKLLPAFWQGMTPEEKQRCLAIHELHGNKYNVACLRQMHEEMHVLLTDMQHLRVCLELAIENPNHVTRGFEFSGAEALPEAVTSAQSAMTDVADGLVTFQLHPSRNGKKVFSGLDLFEHMVKRARCSVPEHVRHVPSAHLDIEYSTVQQELLNPTPQDYMMHAIMAQAHGAGAQQQLAKRKLDALGNLGGACGLANDGPRLQRLHAQLELANSLAEITKANANEAAAKKSQLTTELVGLAPEAILKLAEKGGEVDKLTKNEIRSIAFVHFGGAVLKEADKKDGLVDALGKLMAAQPSIIPALTAAAAAAPSPPLPIAGGGAATATPTTKQAKKAAASKKRKKGDDSSSASSSEEEEHEEPAEEAEDERDYDIAHISAMKKVGSSNLYLVHWEGFAEPSWEPTSGVSNTDAFKEWKALQANLKE